MIKKIIFPILLLLLISCGQDQKNLKVKTTDLKNIEFSTLNEFIKPKKQTFHWRIKNDTIITCEKGTKIYLPKKCFEPNSYNSDTIVEIEISEYYQLSEFISEKLTTLSDKNILETAGMINIRIHQNGKDLALKEGEKYAVLFPKGDDSNPKKAMNTFYGERNSDDLVTWKMKENDALENSTPILPIPSTINTFKTTLRTTKIGNEDVNWKLVGSGEYVPDYLDRKLNPTQKMIDDFKVLGLNPKYDIQYDQTGRVKEIKIIQSSTANYDKIISDFIREMPKVDMSSMPKLNKNNYYQLGFGTHSNFNPEYGKKIKTKFEALKNDVVKNIDKAELNYYILGVSDFGWINCDRFWKTNDEKIDFVIEVKNLDDLNLNLVFADINSIMPATKIGTQYTFKNVPIGREVKLIGIGYKGDSTLLAIEKTKISNQVFELSGFKNFKLKELEEELNTSKN